MLNFYGRKHSRKLKNYQIQDIKNFSFFFEKEKIKTLKEIKKNFEKFNLEIGFGFGENLLNQSLKFKNEFFLGCDPYIKGSINLKKKILFFNLNNLFLTNLDFFDLLKQVDFFFFNKITILFPDPWPKKKHKKRRLINEKFVKLLSKISHEKTKIIVSTDHKDYLRQILYEFHKNPNFRLSTNLLGEKVFRFFNIQSTKYYNKAKINKIETYFMLFEKKN